MVSRQIVDKGNIIRRSHIRPKRMLRFGQHLDIDCKGYPGMALPVGPFTSSEIRDTGPAVVMRFPRGCI